MFKKLKRFLAGVTVATLLAASTLFVAPDANALGQTTATFWTRAIGSIEVLLRSASYHIGSAAQPIAKGWFTDVDVAGTISGAGIPPVDATYITQTADATLTGEQAMGALATGIVKNTTTTGVQSIAAEGTDYYGVGATDVAIADGGTGASTATAGFDALSPLTTIGDLLFGGASGTGSRLGGNTAATNLFLRSLGTGAAAQAPTWSAVTKADVGLGNVSNVATDDTAYDATSWDANTDSSTKNAIRDKIETMLTAIGLNTAKVTESTTATSPLVKTTYDISIPAATNAAAGHATAAHISAIEANTAKDTNVSTALSIGTTTATTVAITSDGGADDVVIPAAINGTAGLLTDAKWDEIVANTGKTTNATHTGDVTGATELTIGAGKVLESHLKCINEPTDEYYLTYEETTGDFEWQTAAGGGDVSKVGTPVDNQIGVWTGDGTIEGDADFIWDSSSLSVARAAIGTAQTVGSSLVNATAAASAAQQFSPVFELEGQGWKTDATAATVEVKWGLQTRPVEGAAAPTGILDFLSSIGGGAFSSKANLTSAGVLTATTFVGALTGQADTVATITGLAPDTATTQATQAAITSAANLATVGTIGTGTWEATDVAVLHGGTGASTASAARTNLGVSIGSNVQAFGAVLDDLNTLGAPASDGQFIVATAAGVFAYESGATALTSIGGIGAATTDTLTNKTFDANATGNSLSNIDVADLANGTDGELITWSADGVATTVGVGTADQVLTSNGAGAAPTFQAVGSSSVEATQTSFTLGETFAEGEAGYIAPASDYDLLNASYASKTFSAASETTLPQDLWISADGTKMYVLGAGDATIYQYTLSTPYDASTGTYASKSKDVSAEDSAIRGMAMSADGTKMYIVGAGEQKIFQYTLSTAWDVSTASYASKWKQTSSEETAPYGVDFSADGTKMYVVGTTSRIVFQYTLSSAWDVSTASYASKSMLVNSEDTSSQSIAISHDGTKIIINGSANKTLYRYTLSTPWDVSTGSYDSSYFLLTSEDTAPYGIVFDSTGLRMYTTGTTNDSVYQYSSGISDDLVFLTDASGSGDELKPIGYANAAGSAGNTIAFNTAGVATVSPTDSPAIGDIMYLSNTAGEVQTSAGTTSVKVGRMISATKMLIIPPPL